MNTHIISDDNFFSLGCEAILESNGLKANKISPKERQRLTLSGEIKSGDVVLLTISSHVQTLKALKYLSDVGAEVILLIDLPKKEYALASWLDAFPSKRMGANLLIPYIKNLTLNADRNIKPLTSREKEVMEKILNGYSLAEISNSLKISVKTIYAHRRNSFKKIGLDHAKSLLFIGYQNHFVNGGA